ncbi:unnamed protein product, partial [Ascophyllum nodosum]
ETLDRNGEVRHKRISASVDEEYVPTASIDVVGLGTETDPRPLESASFRSLDAEETSSTAVEISRIRKSSVDGTSRHVGERTLFISKETPRYAGCARDEQDNTSLLRCHDAPTSKSWFGANGLLSSRRVRSLFCLELLVMFVRIGFFEMYPLWLLASVESGGLGWKLPKIGRVMGWTGVGG